MDATFRSRLLRLLPILGRSGDSLMHRDDGLAVRPRRRGRAFRGDWSAWLRMLLLSGSLALAGCQSTRTASVASRQRAETDRPPATATELASTKSSRTSPRPPPAKANSSAPTSSARPHADAETDVADATPRADADSPVRLVSADGSPLKQPVATAPSGRNTPAHASRPGSTSAATASPAAAPSALSNELRLLLGVRELRAKPKPGDPGPGTNKSANTPGATTREGTDNGSVAATDLDPDAQLIEQIAARRFVSQGPSLSTRLQIPKELPGADAPPITLPDPTDRESREAAVKNLFPPLVGTGPKPDAPPKDIPPTLPGLEEFALRYHPELAQQFARITEAEGKALQDGLAPNPIVGYQADTVNTGSTKGYQGVMLSQTIKTAGKLELARSAATVDIWNQQLALRRNSIDVVTRVRQRYFAALVARENLLVTRALVEFTDAVYTIQVDQLRVGQAAPYEPMQLRSLANQARAAYTQAENRFVSAHRQLATSLGWPTAEMTVVTGNVDDWLPPLDFDLAQSALLCRHTELQRAQNDVLRSQIELRLAEVTPVPDLTVTGVVQKDYTTPPFNTTYNLLVAVPVPVFDRNQGNRLTAHGRLTRAHQESNRLRNDLSTELAQLVEKYQNAHALRMLYREKIIPDQSRTYRGVFERHQQEPGIVGFGDIVVAQQNLLASITTYIENLQGQWDTWCELGGLLQVDHLQELSAYSAGVPTVPPAAGTETAPPASDLTRPPAADTPPNPPPLGPPAAARTPITPRGS